MKPCYAVIVSLMVTQQAFGSQPDASSPYEVYSKTKKEVTYMEWRLVLVNLRLAHNRYYITFDDDRQWFVSSKFVDVATLATVPPADLRFVLESECKLAAAHIGHQFPEFRTRGNKELTIRFISGESPGRHFATFTSGDLVFHDAYWSFRREHER